MTVQADSSKPLSPFGAAVEADGRGRSELAYLIGVDTTTLWRWIAGRHRPSLTIAQRASQVLGRPTDELFPPDSVDLPKAA